MSPRGISRTQSIVNGTLRPQSLVKWIVARHGDGAEDDGPVLPSCACDHEPMFRESSDALISRLQ